MTRKVRKHPSRRSSDDEFVYSSRIGSEMKDSKESPALQMSRFIGGSYGVRKEFFSLSKMSSYERKNLIHKLEIELQQVRDLKKKIARLSSGTVLLSSYTDIHSCSDGPRRPPSENFATYVGSQGKKRRPVRNDKQQTKKGPSRHFECVSSSVDSVMKECETLLNRLWSHKLGWPFRTPVDPVMLNIPDYFTVVKQPMDLGTIRNKLREGEYCSPLDFAADVRLTFSNSMAYNPPGNQYHIMAQSLSKYFESAWKSIEKRLPVIKQPVVHQTSSASLESEIPSEVAPVRKKTVNEDKLRVEPARLVMTDAEKKKLSQDLEELEEDYPQNIVDLLREQSDLHKKISPSQSGEVEIEIDISSLSDKILFTVRKLLDSYFKEKKKSQEKSEPCEMEIVHDSGFSNPPMQSSKGDSLIDEDVDIVGDSPVSSHPPLKIEKDAKCSNSSSSSSESGSSSSDSDTCSSSESEKESIKASHPTSTEEKKEGEVGGLSRKDDNSNGEKIDVNDSLNELGQVEQDVGEKLTAMEAVDVLPDETDPCERQMISPGKRHRMAFLKNRFAETIMKAREKTLTKDERGDPEKLRLEREEFEKRLREEKLRLHAEAKAAEEASRKAEAEAADKARREREQEREAARQALRKMEKTVEINEGRRFMEDLEMLTRAKGDQLPTFMEEMRPNRSEYMLGSFKMKDNSNPLEQLGLYMKMDEDEDEEEDHPHFSQGEDHLFDKSEKEELSPHGVEQEDQLVSWNEKSVSHKAQDNGNQRDERPIDYSGTEEEVENVPEQESRVVDKEEKENEVVDMGEQKLKVADKEEVEIIVADKGEEETEVVDRGGVEIEAVDEEVQETEVIDKGEEGTEVVKKGWKDTKILDIGEEQTEVVDKQEEETEVVDMKEEDIEVVEKGRQESEIDDKEEAEVVMDEEK